jgi:ceramide glucosyltransferase
MLGFVPLAVGLVSSLVLLVAYQSVFLRLSRTGRHESLDDSSFPPVSILKPLCGVDPGLYENLRAIVEQQHPGFQVIFGAEDPFDPALEVARRLAREFPERDIQVVGGGAPTSGVNPKVRILRRLIELARHEWVLISDSNVRPRPDYLKAMQSVQIREQADLVHTVLSGTGGESWGARLEELQLNGWVAAAICFADRFNHPCVIGKSMLMRRSFLVGEGALGRVQDILAEDYTLGAELHQRGRKVALAPYLLPVVTGTGSLQAFLNRHIRWGQMRRRIAPLSFFAELSANPTPFFLGSLFFLEGKAFDVAFVAQLLKWSLDLFAYLRLSERPSLKTAALLPLKDLLVLVMWFVSAFKRTVLWRGHLMWVGPGSRLSPVNSDSMGPELESAGV